MSFMYRLLNIPAIIPIILYIIRYIATFEIMKVTVSGKTYCTYTFGAYYTNPRLNRNRILILTDRYTGNYILLVDNDTNQFNNEFYHADIYSEENSDITWKMLVFLLRILMKIGF